MDEYYNQGWEAFDDGVELNKNPYGVGSHEAYHWGMGWIQCEDTREQGNED